MGTTVVGAMFSPSKSKVFIGHVGDSRCYRVRQGQIKLLTRDHSLVNDYITAIPNLTDEQKADLPKNVITRALGMQKDVVVDLQADEPQPGDIYVLCSDGLNGMLRDEEILEIVTAHGLDLSAGARKLIDVANANGGEDNITVVLIHIESVPGAVEPVPDPRVSAPTFTEEDTLSGELASFVPTDPHPAPAEPPAASTASTPPAAPVTSAPPPAPEPEPAGLFQDEETLVSGQAPKGSLPQQRVQLPRPVERQHVVAASDGRPVDEDLRYRRLACRLPEPRALRRVAGHVDLLVVHPLLAQVRLGAHTEGAKRRRVDGDLGGHEGSWLAIRWNRCKSAAMFVQPQALRRVFWPALAGLLWACDGTLSGMHATRGILPTVYAEPLPSAQPDSWNPGEPKAIRAQHLLIMHQGSRSAPPTVVRTKEEARARAEEALARVREGASMDDIVAQYSEEPGAAQREPPGDLGEFSRKRMVKKFSDAAFKLQVGEVSGVVETEFGFHVIKRLE
jgi:hypothetical protein